MKFVSKEDKYLVIEQGVLEFKDNELNILALEAQIGDTLETAKSTFDRAKREKLEITKKENIDYST